jgi:hypothetical protein
LTIIRWIRLFVLLPPPSDSGMPFLLIYDLSCFLFVPIPNVSTLRRNNLRPLPHRDNPVGIAVRDVLHLRPCDSMNLRARFHFCHATHSAWSGMQYVSLRQSTCTLQSTIYSGWVCSHHVCPVDTLRGLFSSAVFWPLCHPQDNHRRYGVPTVTGSVLRQISPTRCPALPGHWLSTVRNLLG